MTKGSMAMTVHAIARGPTRPTFIDPARLVDLRNANLEHPPVRLPTAV